MLLGIFEFLIEYRTELGLLFVLVQIEGVNDTWPVYECVQEEKMSRYEHPASTQVSEAVTEQAPWLDAE